MIKYLLAIVATALYFNLSAQRNDSIVKKSDIVFKNEIDKTIFFNSAEGNSNYLELFLESYLTNDQISSSAAAFKINNCVEELREKIKGKNEEKDVKFIYSYVHKKFFTKYENKNSFADIFNNGYYNCVSSTALYAIIFTKLDIPFQILEKPGHVLLIAYPNTHKIFLETTNPYKGYIQYTDTYVKEFVSYLYSMNVITQVDYESKSSSELFEKYYYSSTPISLKALAAIQFANFSLYQLQDGNYPLAVAEIKKACYLDDYNRNRYLLKFTLMNELRNNNYNELVYVKDFSILCRFNAINSKDITDQIIVDEFKRLTYHQLIEASSFEKYDLSYSEIVSSIKDTALRAKITFIYHFELARLGLVDARKDAYVYQHLSAAYKINPEQADLRTLVKAQLSRKVEASNDARKILEELDNYGEDFSFLNENAWFGSVKCNCLLQMGYENFVLGNPQKGEDYLKEFEKLQSTNKEITASDIFVEKAYSEAATRYYKKGDVKRCKETLRKGLIYAPNSFALKMRLNQS